MSAQAHRILLVEDDRFLRKAAAVELKRHGFAVTTACDGEEALRMARDETPELILLDLIMPKMQGFEVLRNLKEHKSTAHIPVIIMSNLGQDKDMQNAMEGGAMGYLIKSNLSLKEMAHRVEEALTPCAR